MRCFAKSVVWISAAFVAGAISAGLIMPAGAQDAFWIWSPAHPKEEVPQTSCHFRKVIELAAPTKGEMVVAADDQYELHINGRRVGTGGSSAELDRYDVSEFLMKGRNLIAIKATNTRGTTAAVVAAIGVEDEQDGELFYATDDTWRTSLNPLPFWFTPLYNDARWSVAQTFGPLGSTEPWDTVPTPDPETIAEAATAPTSNGNQIQGPVEMQTGGPFQIVEDFRIDQLLDSDHTGSLIAMTFNEFGHVVASRDGGSLLLIHDSNDDGNLDSVREYCKHVKNCQGILCLNGEVFVTGDGPDGIALYRLSDRDRNGSLESVRTLLQFDGQAGEFGPHGITLGTDGYLYVSVGNHVTPRKSVGEDSPYSNYCEGDLVQPRRTAKKPDQPAIKAPGGTIVRVDLEGKHVQAVAGGLNNAYDLVFNRQGELFVFDNDVQGDMGTPWHRPASLLHVTAGAEFGWRDGWAVRPNYFVDTLPGVLEMDRVAPTGLTVYEHHQFPERYQGAMFVGDWYQGRILAVTLKPNGSSFTANSEVFLTGDSMGVTDLAVGPKGGLYFCTGGRNTVGGLYRVTWKKAPDPTQHKLGTGISRVIRQPQLHSAWSRQQIAAVKSDVGSDWSRLLPGVAISAANPWYYRTRALDLMQLYGPAPTTDLLVQLSEDKNEAVRAKVADLMGVHANADTRAALIQLLQDTDRNVRRHACEALTRAKQYPEVDTLVELLASDDRAESWAARRLLEQIPAEQWESLQTHENTRVRIQGMLARLSVEPNASTATSVLEQASEVMSGFVTDRDFIDLLRVMQLALGFDESEPSELTSLREQLAQEFPAGDQTINRELIRLLTHLKITSIMDRYMNYLRSENVSDMDKLHLAMHLAYFHDGWLLQDRMELLDLLETAQRRQGGSDYAQYVAETARDLAKSMNADESAQVLAAGVRWPNAALGVMYRLPEELDDQTREDLSRLDEQLIEQYQPAHMRLKVAIVAVLARSGDEASMEYLRRLWNTDPERRQAIAMGLAQQPNEKNWEYLVRSLPLLEGVSAREVLTKLQNISLAPEGPEFYRHVILRGLELNDTDAVEAIKLLEFWTGEKLGAEQAINAQEKLALWQAWYHERWPDRPLAELATDSPDSRWHYADLLRHLTTGHGLQGDASKGQNVFATAQCINCHQSGDLGNASAPDLSKLGERMMRKEMLQAVLYPSHVISPEYATTVVVTTDGTTHSGIASEDSTSGQVTLLESDGKVHSFQASEIAEMKPELTSLMPENLLNDLSLEEIADLFAFLRSPDRTSLAEQSQPDTEETIQR